MTPGEPISEPADEKQEVGHLEMTDGRLVLVVAGEVRRVSAADVLNSVVRGADSIAGVRLDVVPRISCPGIRFRPVTLPVRLRLEIRGDRLFAEPVVTKGELSVVLQASDDHVLIANDWHPAEAESLALVAAWAARETDPSPQGQASALMAAYAELPSDLVEDRLSDAEVWNLAPAIVPPKPLSETLRPFQLTGFRWILARVASGRGSILADGMGSGKTIQAIAVVTTRRHEGRPPALIAVPTTLLENWRREILRFAPQLVFYVHHGPGRTRRPAELRKASVDAVLTSHDTAARDSGFLRLLNWDLLVVDEGQRLRNPDGSVRSELQLIERGSTIVLTGTPMENRALDLWSLVDFVEPGYLGPRESFASGLGKDPSRLRASVRPVLLRRPPEIVAADMPDLLSQDVHLAMYDQEATAYEEIIDELGKPSGGSALEIINRLRAFVAHPQVERGAGATTLPSAKLDRTIEMLDELMEAGEKVVVFCWYRIAAGLLEATIGQRLGAAVFSVDGNTPIHLRQTTIDEFSALPGGAVLILNPKAAGVGLNVQAASRVIHYTLEWNPATEDQATARVWRSGQTRQVVRHRLIYDGTIDEALIDTMARKRDEFESNVPVGDTDVRDLTRLLAAALATRPARLADQAEQESPETVDRGGQ